MLKVVFTAFMALKPPRYKFEPQVLMWPRKTHKGLQLPKVSSKSGIYTSRGSLVRRDWSQTVPTYLLEPGGDVRSQVANHEARDDEEYKCADGINDYDEVRGKVREERFLYDVEAPDYH